MSDDAPLEPVLIVDDERNIRRTIRMVLEGGGHAVHEAGTAAEAESVLARERIDVILLDVKLGEDNGLDLLRALKAPREDGARTGDIPVVMISGHATIEDAVSATRLGAFDFMEKPLDRNRVMVTVRNALERRKMAKELHQLRHAVDGRWELLGGTPVMAELRRQIAKVAPTRSRILITGESGTGKELIARAIHRNSSVASGAFVKVNCAAIPPELIESELFGHERGAFTGAVAKKRGLFEVADGGTIFLDEITEMPMELQVKLLRVLETSTVTRVGGTQLIPSDVRVICATNREPEKAVADNKLREDLYHRLNVFPIRLPPLRERDTDIEQLAQFFLDDLNKTEGTNKSFSRDALVRLYQHSWPGNVRELKNYVQRTFIMADDIIELDVAISDAPPKTDDGTTITIRVGTPLEEVERRVTMATLAYCGHVKRKAAEILGVSLKTLYNRLETYNGKEAVGAGDKDEAASMDSLR